MRTFKTNSKANALAMIGYAVIVTFDFKGQTLKVYYFSGCSLTMGLRRGMFDERLQVDKTLNAVP